MLAVVMGTASRAFVYGFHFTVSAESDKMNTNNGRKIKAGGRQKLFM